MKRQCQLTDGMTPTLRVSLNVSKKLEPSETIKHMSYTVYITIVPLSVTHMLLSTSQWMLHAANDRLEIRS